MMVPACSPLRICSISIAALSLGMLGCGANLMPSDNPLAGGQLRGSIHGGEQPVSGASIQLYAAGTTGYGSAATPLLSSPVVSGADGSFSITGAYSCPSSSSQLYVVATGGNPGLAPGMNNPALAMMSALGPCNLHGAQYTLDPNAYISINEVTTVASVYALAPFMAGDATHIGTSSTNAIGLANSFQTVNNLVDITTGVALATTPAGNGAVPQATINTLANIVSTCVNSNGTGSACAALAAATTPSWGTAPSDTLQGTYNVAMDPGAKVSALYALAGATTPFQPALTIAPNDWTMTVHYTGTEISGPLGISLDSVGDVWIANDPGSVVELSSNGTNLSGATGFTGGGINGPRGMAIDLSGNAWVANFFGNSVTKLSNSGSILSGPNGFTGGISGVNGPEFVAIDGTGNAWVTNSSSPAVTVTKLAGDGSLIAAGLSPCSTAATCQFESAAQIAIDGSEDLWIPVSVPQPGAVAKLSGGGAVLSGQNGFTNALAYPGFIAIDHSGNAWVTNYTSDGVSNNVTKLDSSGTLIDSVNVPGLSDPYGIAIDGSGNAWAISNSATVVEVSNNLTVLSGTQGYVDSTPLNVIPGCTIPPSHSCVVPRDSEAIAVDGSGNVWVSNTDKSISEFIGVATPVVTPLSIGVKNNTLGTRP